MHKKSGATGAYLKSGLGLIFFLFMITWTLSAQTTTVQGLITDQETGQPIPYVTILFKNTQIGTLSDSTGHYKLISKNKVDSIQFSAVGYHGKTFAVLPLKVMDLPVSLLSDMIKIQTVNVTPDDGPVRRIMKEMVDRKKQNNPAKYPRYAYRKYTKWEYHLNNVGAKMINSKAFRNDKSVFKTDADNSKYLPIYFSEQIVYNEIQRNPSRQKSTVLADKTSGVGVLDDYEISGYTSALDIEMNFYDNFINLFSQNFVSPLADNGGPTFTHALLAGSPAVDLAGIIGCPAADQRGSAALVGDQSAAERGNGAGSGAGQPGRPGRTGRHQRHFACIRARAVQLS